MPQQRLHDCEIHPGVGQCGAERVPQRVRGAGTHPGHLTVVAEDRAQPCGVSGWPRVGPFATTNNAVVVAVSGRSCNRWWEMTAAKSPSRGPDVLCRLCPRPPRRRRDAWS